MHCNDFSRYACYSLCWCCRCQLKLTVTTSGASEALNCYVNCNTTFHDLVGCGIHKAYRKSYIPLSNQSVCCWQSILTSWIPYPWLLQSPAGLARGYLSHVLPLFRLTVHTCVFLLHRVGVSGNWCLLCNLRPLVIFSKIWIFWKLWRSVNQDKGIENCWVTRA